MGANIYFKLISSPLLRHLYKSDRLCSGNVRNVFQRFQQMHCEIQCELHISIDRQPRNTSQKWLAQHVSRVKIPDLSDSPVLHFGANIEIPRPSQCPECITRARSSNSPRGPWRDQSSCSFPERAPIGPIRTLIDEPFEGLAEIEEPVDGQLTAVPELIEVVEVVVGAVEDRAVLVGRSGRELPLCRQPGCLGMAGPQRLVLRGRRGTSGRRRIRARRRRRQRRDDGRRCG